MKKRTALFSILLVIQSLAGCGSSSNNKKIKVSEDDKNVFLICKQKTDVVKNSLSELTMDESGEYNDNFHASGLIRKNSQKYYNELTKGKYLTLQNFGLYVLNNVFHSINYGYESENIELDQMIYDEVQNELNGDYRNYLKQAGITNKFYMLLDKNETNYTFKVDWLGDGNFRGNIYVNGNIEIEDDDVKSFTLTSFTEDKGCYIFAAHYDFVDNYFYLFNTSHDDVSYLSTTKEIINKINNNNLDANELDETEYYNISVATGKITKNVKDINYRGYIRDTWGTNEDKTLFCEVFNSLKDKISKVNVRTSKTKLDYSKSKRVHFMDAALQYGLDTTKLYLTRIGSAIFPYIEKDDLITLCENSSSEYSKFLSKVKTHLMTIDDTSYSLNYNDGVVSLNSLVTNEQYFSLNTYSVDEVKFALSYNDEESEDALYFMLKGESMIILGFGCMHSVDVSSPDTRINDLTYHHYEIESTQEEVIETQLENGLIQKTTSVVKYARCKHCNELVEVERVSETYVGYYIHQNNYYYLDEFDPFFSYLVKGEYYSYNFMTHEFDSYGYQDNEYNYNEEFNVLYLSHVERAFIIDDEWCLEENAQDERIFETIDNGYRMYEAYYSYGELMYDQYIELTTIQEDDSVTIQVSLYEKNLEELDSEYTLASSGSEVIKMIDKSTIDVNETYVFYNNDYTFNFHQVFEYEPNVDNKPTLSHYSRESVIPDDYAERLRNSASGREILNSLNQTIDIDYTDTEFGTIATMSCFDGNGQKIKEEELPFDDGDQIVKGPRYEAIIIGGLIREVADRVYFSLLNDMSFD